MKTRYLFLTFALFLTASFMACGDDDGPAGSGGSSAGGAGGTGGDGGLDASAGQSGSGGSGGSQNPQWVKGQVGTADRGVIILSQGSGQIQGMTLKPGMVMRTMDADAGAAGMAGSAGAGGASGSAGSAGAGTPNTVPKVDLSQITPDFTELWFPIPPYQDQNMGHTIPPLTGILTPDGNIHTLQHFQTWEDELTIKCFGTFPVMVNGKNMRSYGGLSLDMATCLDRHFLISNGSDKVWELYDNGNKSVIVEDLDGASAIFCHPQGYLVVTTLPQYEKNADISPPVIGVRLWKVALDGATNEIAELPVTADYATPQSVATCWTFPYTDKAMPAGLSIPIALRPDNSFLVGDVGARKIYTVSEDGANIDEFGGMPMLTASAVLAPNDVVYRVDAPLLGQKNDGNPVYVLEGLKIHGYDGVSWSEIIAFDGYDQYAETMSWGLNAVSCPAQYTEEDICLQPWGVFAKVQPGASPVLYVMDPIKGQFSAVPLSMGNDPDAGAAGSAGSSGAGGSAGAAGSAGSSGASGTAGSSGSSGAGGASGSAGSSGSAGAAP
ncbi:MAG: hypothetical protein ACOYUZ_04305 [Patescibacteria group bacterium]